MALPVFLILCVLGLFIYVHSRLTDQSVPLSVEHQEEVISLWRKTEGNPDFIWKDTLEATQGVHLPVYARSAILLDAATGEVLYEKNADQAIPPASLTKIAAIYTALMAERNGEISLDDKVHLTEESWAQNMPPGSSLMFLGPLQTVTVRELIEGMCVVSGNDAAVALAIHVSGSVPSFVERMNAEMKKRGLAYTSFVEPTGLSEFNTTTAREFAYLAKAYIQEFPQNLESFHSREEFSYPNPWNLEPGNNELPVKQTATNKLLSVLPGTDGLKTGFIFESGYNLALTVQRNGVRFLSVTMGGPGTGTREGNHFRVLDGTTLMEWAFSSFTTISLSEPKKQHITVWGGTVPTISLLFPADTLVTIPLAGENPQNTVSRIELKLSIPREVQAPVRAGDALGRAEYILDGETMLSVPLIADRDSPIASRRVRYLDRFARSISRFVSVNQR